MFRLPVYLLNLILFFVCTFILLLLDTLSAAFILQGHFCNINYLMMDFLLVSFFFSHFISLFSCRYNENDQPVCRVCDVVLKSESIWPAHQASRKHHEVILRYPNYASISSFDGGTHILKDHIHLAQRLS